ncbi:MAG: hypothetical protein MPJ81_07775 [Gammaproteobacteria bacterium]|nr:hypothetical protein [Gammaproteobacteria bacterium]
MKFTFLGSFGVPVLAVRASDQATGAWPLVYAIWTVATLPAAKLLPTP